MAARLMATGTSRAGLGLAVVAVALAACSGSGGAGTTAGTTAATPTSSSAKPSAAGSAAAFSWLHPQAAPRAWRLATIANGASMAYPPNWSPQEGDPGTATAALLAPRGRYLGYLNLTPRQGAETLSNWASFRTEHNADEGDRAVKRLAAATGLHFGTGQGSCVKDSYTTWTNDRFIELACLVSGPHGETVIVGAAPPNTWASSRALIERAVDGVRG